MLENDSEKIGEITTIEELQQDLAVFFSIDQENWYLWSPTLDNQIVETQRLIMQQSVFLFGLPEVDPEMITQEIIVHSDAKEKIRTTLEKMGISERTLFSDLLGFFERNSATQPYNLYSALLISDFWYLFFKPTWFQRSTSNFRWIREDIRAK